MDDFLAVCRRSWLIDSNRIATKIMSASASSDPRQVVWKSNPSRHCPKCQHVIDNSDVCLLFRFIWCLVSHIIFLCCCCKHKFFTFPGCWWLARIASRCEIWSIWSWDHMAFASQIWFVRVKLTPFHWWVHPNRQSRWWNLLHSS